MGLVALVPAAAAWLRGRNPNPSKNLQVLLDYYVIVCIVVIFDGLGPLIRAVNPVDKDPALIAFDRLARRRYRPDASTSSASRLPFLSDVLTVCYALYYFHPIVLGALVLVDDPARRPPARARVPAPTSFTMVFVFFVSYVGYFLVPAIGPALHRSRTPARSRAGRWPASIDETLEQARERTSGTASPRATRWSSRPSSSRPRGGRGRRSWWFLPFAVGLVLATVFCRYHYVVGRPGRVRARVRCGAARERALQALPAPALNERREKQGRWRDADAVRGSCSPSCRRRDLPGVGSGSAP